MHYRSFLLIVVLLWLLSSSVFPQSEYKIEGRYKKQTAQGMAVWKDKAFLLNKTGWCREYDLKRRRIVRAFKLACYNEKNHANNASFGVEMVDDSNVPVIYVSECVKPYRCFIEDISGEKPRPVQTIVTVCKGDNGIAMDWIVDTKKKKLYTISKFLVSEGDKNCWRNHIVRFRLPLLSEGPIVKLTEKDIEDSFDVLFPSILQGATIKGRYMYVSVGLQKGHEERFDSQRGIIVIDLKTHLIKKSIDLMRLTDNEPEGIDFYGRQLLLFCGQSGGIFKIRR